MPDQEPKDPRRRELARRRRLAEVFGDVLPEATRDDTPDPPDTGSGADERWYTDNRPPHHDAG